MASNVNTHTFDVATPELMEKWGLANGSSEK